MSPPESLSDLVKNKTYLLLKLEKLETHFGEGILASLLVKNNVRKIYLPKIYATKLSEDDVEEINEGSFEIRYLGPEGLSHKYTLVKGKKDVKKLAKKVIRNKYSPQHDRVSTSKIDPSRRFIT